MMSEKLLLPPLLSHIARSENLLLYVVEFTHKHITNLVSCSFIQGLLSWCGRHDIDSDVVGSKNAKESCFNDLPTYRIIMVQLFRS